MREIETTDCEGLCMEEYCGKKATHCTTIKVREMDLVIALCERHGRIFEHLDSLERCKRKIKQPVTLLGEKRPDGVLGYQIECPYCGDYHLHGIGAGHRQAHCQYRTPESKQGYFIINKMKGKELKALLARARKEAASAKKRVKQSESDKRFEKYKLGILHSVEFLQGYQGTGGLCRRMIEELLQGEEVEGLKRICKKESIRIDFSFKDEGTRRKKLRPMDKEELVKAKKRAEKERKERKERRKKTK